MTGFPQAALYGDLLLSRRQILRSSSGTVSERRDLTLLSDFRRRPEFVACRPALVSAGDSFESGCSFLSNSLRIILN